MRESCSRVVCASTPCDKNNAAWRSKVNWGVKLTWGLPGLIAERERERPHPAVQCLQLGHLVQGNIWCICIIWNPRRQMGRILDSRGFDWQTVRVREPMSANHRPSVWQGYFAVHSHMGSTAAAASLAYQPINHRPRLTIITPWMLLVKSQFWQSLSLSLLKILPLIQTLKFNFSTLEKQKHHHQV